MFYKGHHSVSCGIQSGRGVFDRRSTTHRPYYLRLKIYGHNNNLKYKYFNLSYDYVSVPTKEETSITELYGVTIGTTGMWLIGGWRVFFWICGCHVAGEFFEGDH